MKLDAQVLRYLSKDDFRVLTAIEQGMKNHEYVSLQLIASIAHCKGGKSATKAAISNLHRHKLIYHNGQLYDGYRLTYSGYDYLALRVLVNRGVIDGIGRRIGVGKESDIYEAINSDGERIVLKFERLGRTSFRAVKDKRDYMGKKRTSASWFYLSRLAAMREFAYMQALYERDFPVPKPIEHNRHVIAMSFIPGCTLYRVRAEDLELHEAVDENEEREETFYSRMETSKAKITYVSDSSDKEDAESEEEGSEEGFELEIEASHVYNQCMSLLVRLLDIGLVHGDFNEFNLIIGVDNNVTLIDFPQMLSVDHSEAENQFNRDVECVATFFRRKYNYTSDFVPKFVKSDQNNRVIVEKK